jgi:hypothetical protein
MIVLQGARVLGNNLLSDQPDFALPAALRGNQKKTAQM